MAITGNMTISAENWRTAAKISFKKVVDDSATLEVCNCGIARPVVEHIVDLTEDSAVVIIYIQRKIFFRATIFLYSPCPNLEGIKDALSYKFRILTIGQNCAVCTNEVARA